MMFPFQILFLPSVFVVFDGRFSSFFFHKKKSKKGNDGFGIRIR